MSQSEPASQCLTQPRSGAATSYPSDTTGMAAAFGIDGSPKVKVLAFDFPEAIAL
jgi:hypothetical protein